MVKHTQRIRRLLLTNCLNVFDHFVGLALNGLTNVLHIINKQHATIKFSFVVSKETVLFLDTKVYIDNDQNIKTIDYHKKVDGQRYLCSKSEHPL